MHGGDFRPMTFADRYRWVAVALVVLVLAALVEVLW